MMPGQSLRYRKERNGKRMVKSWHTYTILLLTGVRVSVQSRLQRERKTIQTMIEIYCAEQHHPEESLCPECQQLFQYAMLRIDKCPYQADKPTCATCPIHCYKPTMRAQVRQVMRYSGPRMLARHPILAIRHMIDEKIHRKTEKPARAES